MDKVMAAVEAIPNAITKNLPVPANHTPPQNQELPGLQSEMRPAPLVINELYRGSGKLDGKVALITGGDSGIGRSVAVHFAREGADVGISYLSEHSDAQETKRLVEAEGRKCLLIPGDIKSSQVCNAAVDKVVAEFGHLDILVNNAAEQHVQMSLKDISDEQLEATFKLNIFAYFYMARAALPHLEKSAKERGDAAIINSTSVLAYMGMGELLDYSTTKGAIVSFTRSLSQQLVSSGIRVNGVAPGPIWTPLIPATFPKAAQATWANSVPMNRHGQPAEVAPSYVFLASGLMSSYISGSVVHPNGGTIINS